MISLDEDSALVLNLSLVSVGDKVGEGVVHLQEERRSHSNREEVVGGTVDIIESTGNFVRNGEGRSDNVVDNDELFVGHNSVNTTLLNSSDLNNRGSAFSGHNTSTDFN